MKKRIIKINESQLRNIIKSSVQNVINESLEKSYNEQSRTDIVADLHMLNERFTKYAQLADEMADEFEDLNNNLKNALNKLGLYIELYYDYDMSEFVDGKAFSGELEFKIRKKGLTKEKYNSFPQEEKYRIMDQFNELCEQLEDEVYPSQYKTIECKFNPYSAHIDLIVKFSLWY